jgi:hypothetical protein
MAQTRNRYKMLAGKSGGKRPLGIHVIGTINLRAAVDAECCGHLSR